MRLPKLVRAAVYAATLLLPACGPVAGPGALPLEIEDFTLAGVPADVDSAEIRLSFGDPDSVVISPNPYDAYSPILSWYYADFIVRYDGHAMPSSFLLTGPGESTLRGVRVGDPSDRVLQLYGPPAMRYDPVWTYADPEDDVSGRVLEFLIEDDVVSRIHLAPGER